MWNQRLSPQQSSSAALNRPPPRRPPSGPRRRSGAPRARGDAGAGCRAAPRCDGLAMMSRVPQMVLSGAVTSASARASVSVGANGRLRKRARLMFSACRWTARASMLAGSANISTRQVLAVDRGDLGRAHAHAHLGERLARVGAQAERGNADQRQRPDAVPHARGGETRRSARRTRSPPAAAGPRAAAPRRGPPPRRRQWSRAPMAAAASSSRRGPGCPPPTARSAATARGMLRIQCVHEPEPPWNSTSGSPAPHTRHTIVPSPQGVRTLRAVRASRSTMAAGSASAVMRLLEWELVRIRRGSVAPGGPSIYPEDADAPDESPASRRSVRHAGNVRSKVTHPATEARPPARLAC